MKMTTKIVFGALILFIFMLIFYAGIRPDLFWNLILLCVGIFFFLTGAYKSFLS